MGIQIQYIGFVAISTCGDMTFWRSRVAESKIVFVNLELAPVSYTLIQSTRAKHLYLCPSFHALA